MVAGMSERVLLDHFLTVGNSRATEKAYASENYAPIARFGIGILVRVYNCRTI